MLFQARTIYLLHVIDIGLSHLKGKNAFQDLCTEIERSMAFCNHQIKSVEFSNVLVTPLNTKKQKLIENLQLALDLPVKELGFSDLLKNAEKIQAAKRNVSTFVIGAALNQLGQQEC